MVNQHRIGIARAQPIQRFIPHSKQKTESTALIGFDRRQQTHAKHHCVHNEDDCRYRRVPAKKFAQPFAPRGQSKAQVGAALMASRGADAYERAASGAQLRPSLLATAAKHSAEHSFQALQAHLPLIGKCQHSSLHPHLRVPIIPESRLRIRRKDNHGQIRRTWAASRRRTHPLPQICGKRGGSGNREAHRAVPAGSGGKNCGGFEEARNTHSESPTASSTSPARTQTVTLGHRAFPILVSVITLLASGCAAKRPITDHQPSASGAPQPSSTSEENTEVTKNSTIVTPSPAVSSAPAHPKHSKTPPTPLPSGYTEEGNASWYGNPFHGRRSSNGEVYDMYKFTAAHRTMPFETMVRVTNLNNGKTVTVRITDRGPFVDNRIIDLSQAAAREIESIGPGVVPVRLEVLGNVDVTAGFFTVQVGAFRDRSNAERLRERLSAAYSPIFIQPYDSPDGTFFRVRVGKISGEDAAHDFGEQLRAKEGFQPMILRLDEGVMPGVSK